MAKQSSLVMGLKDHAWAIELKRKDWPLPGTAWAGIYNWASGNDVLVCQGGVTTAVFATRDLARQARMALWGYGSRRAIVRKVRVHIEVLSERKR